MESAPKNCSRSNHDVDIKSRRARWRWRPTGHHRRLGRRGGPGGQRHLYCYCWITSVATVLCFSCRCRVLTMTLLRTQYEPLIKYCQITYTLPSDFLLRLFLLLKPCFRLDAYRMLSEVTVVLAPCFKLSLTYSNTLYQSLSRQPFSHHHLPNPHNDNIYLLHAIPNNLVPN